MKGIPTVRLSRLKRGAVLAGVGALVVAGTVLGTTQAHAADIVLGTDHGALVINDATAGVSGTAIVNEPTTDTINYDTTEACPAAESGSATVYAIDPTDPTGTDTNQESGSQTAVGSPFTLGATTAEKTISKLLTTFPQAAGNTTEFVVQCQSGDLTKTAYVMDTFVTINAAGTQFSVTNTPPSSPPANVSVTLQATPSPATSGQQVTLTATVTPGNATGSIQFGNNSTVIGTVPIANGTASIPTSFSGITTATTETLTATYLPTGNFAATTPGSATLTVNPAPPNSGTIPLAVNVPQSGTFSLTVDSTDWVVLGVNTAGTTATAATTPIVVTDTRNYYPGWSVTGEATQWTGVTDPSTETPAGYPAATDIPADHGTQTIAADQLGWAPTNTGTLPQGVGLGNQITAGTTPGLGDAAQLLASVHAGTGNGFTGTSGLTLGANLTLAIPAGQEAGPYAADLNIDATDSLP
jgi:hypothetical protein